MGRLAGLIGKEKDVIANLIYQEIEPLIKINAAKIGRRLGFDGDLLRYFTLQEIKDFFKQKKISKNKLAELFNRRKGYFYLFFKNRDIIKTDKKLIAKLKKGLLDGGRESRIVRGITAYPGKAKGRVLNSFHGVKNYKPNHILVTNITKPQDTPLLKKFLAIVTDEGGILSHVAVIAREFKIPAVMSTKNATRVLKDGDLVEVDAGEGIIKKLNK